jgi:hypothetical protein
LEPAPNNHCSISIRFTNTKKGAKPLPFCSLFCFKRGLYSFFFTKNKAAIDKKQNALNFIEQDNQEYACQTFRT